MASFIRRKIPEFLLLIALFLLPSVLFWDSLWLRFGFRDDYSTLREAHEEPGKLFDFCAAQGRPIYGLLVESTFAEIDGIDQFPWARILGALSIGIVCAGAMILLQRQGWPRRFSFCCALLLGVLPSAQVVINWGSCWPHAFAAALGVLAFGLSDRGLRDPRPYRRLPWVVAGTAVLLTGLLVYQPDSLLYVVMMTAGFLVWPKSDSRRGWRWLCTHVLLVCLALITAFAVIKTLFIVEGFPVSKRISLEADIPGKVLWFLREPLDNALGLFVLEDSVGRAHVWHVVASSVVGFVICMGVLLQVRREGWRTGLQWVVAGLALGTLAYAVSFVAAERWASYRTLYALSGVVVIFLMRSLWLLGETLPRSWRHASFVVMASIAGLGAVQASQTSEDFFALPQERELKMLEKESLRIEPLRNPRVFIILPDPAATRCELRYLDEYGSLSADTEWCTKEMIRLILEERYPEAEGIMDRVSLKFGYVPPVRPGAYDTVIDLRVRPPIAQPGQVSVPSEAPKAVPAGSVASLTSPSS